MWKAVWFQARREALRADRYCCRWRIVCGLGFALVIVAVAWIWLARAQGDWRPLVLLGVSLVITALAGSQHLRRIDRVACRMLPTPGSEHPQSTARSH